MKTVSSNITIGKMPIKKQAIYSGILCFLFLFSGIMPIQAQRGEGNRHPKEEKVRNQHEKAMRKENKQEMKLERRDERRGPLRERPYNRPDNRQINNSYTSRENVTVNNHFDNRSPRNWPARGTTINVLPSGSVFRVHAGVRIAFNNGIFYRPYSGHFVVCAPPIGFRIHFLPVGFITFSMFNTPYYYYAGAYYQRYGGEYVVVQPPLGALVQSIPDGGQQLVIDGNTYYIVDGVQYQAVIYNGNIWYKVIKIEGE